MAMAPANYSGLANLMNLQGVGVNPTSQLAYVPSKDLMTRYQTVPNPRTGIPQAVGVTGMAEGGTPSQQYPMQEEAMELANRGRYGDTTLVHMTPGEVQGLASLGQLTINPDTGLPEAFSLKSIIPIAGGIVGGMFGGPAGAALGSGLGTAITGGSTKDILLSAGLSFAGGMIMQGGGSIFGESGGGLSSLFGGGAEAATAGAEAAAGAGAEAVGEGIVSSAVPQATANIPAASQGLASAAALPPPAMMFDPYLAAQQPAMMFDPNLATPAMQTLGGDFAGATSTLGEAGAIDFGGVEQSPSLFDRVSKSLSDFYKEELSPSRPGLPKDASLLQKYGRLGAVGVGGLAAADALFGEDPEEQQLARRKPLETDFGKVELVGGDVRRPIPTEEEFRRRAVEGGSERYFEPYRYVRRAAEGGIVGLQQGGMATPQAPSAMSAMLTPPVQQSQPIQPINIAVQPPQQQPQQPQPMAPMGQGPAPLPDQQKEFMKMMDMEEQVQGQRRSDSTQALATIMGLGMNQVTSQYPQTSPSGQAVQPPLSPPMTYGSQVNLGLAGGGQPYFEGQVEGPGDGQSDEVAFRVDGGQVDGAMLSPDEYVLAADVVSAIGNGSSDAGAAKLDQFMKNVRQDAYGTTKQMQPFNNQGLTNLVA